MYVRIGGLLIRYVVLRNRRCVRIVIWFMCVVLLGMWNIGLGGRHQRVGWKRYSDYKCMAIGSCGCIRLILTLCINIGESAQRYRLAKAGDRSVRINLHAGM